MILILISLKECKMTLTCRTEESHHSLPPLPWLSEFETSTIFRLAFPALSTELPSKSHCLVLDLHMLLSSLSLKSMLRTRTPS